MRQERPGNSRHARPEGCLPGAPVSRPPAGMAGNAGRRCSRRQGRFSISGAGRRFFKMRGGGFQFLVILIGQSWSFLVILGHSWFSILGILGRASGLWSIGAPQSFCASMADSSSSKSKKSASLGGGLDGDSDVSCTTGKRRADRRDRGVRVGAMPQDRPRGAHADCLGGARASLAQLRVAKAASKSAAKNTSLRAPASASAAVAPAGGRRRAPSR